MSNLRIHSVGAALFCCFTVSAWADTLTVDTVDRGYYYNSDFHDTTNKNYLTGQINFDTSATGFHSFFAFDALSGLTGPIVSATLNLYNPVAGYSSTQATELLNISGFSGNVATLVGGGTVAGEYSALASGTVFGSQSVSSANDGSFITFTLNADAIAFLNANSGSAFAFGGYLGGLNNSDTRFVFGGSSSVSAADGNTTLTIVTASAAPSAVPEPKTTGLAVIGLLALLMRYRRAVCSQHPN
jgi:hypothetical protein